MQMSCALCRVFILDFLQYPLHPENPLHSIFRPSNLLPYKDILCFWIQRIQRSLTNQILAKAKQDTEMDFYLDNIHQVKQEVWNKAFMKNLLECNLAVSTKLSEFQIICEECGFLKQNTETFFLENYIVPLLQTAVEIHLEHSAQTPVYSTSTNTHTKYTDKQLREEYGNLYD
jgi:hypothetical protein